jgi:hypothetical protein
VTARELLLFRPAVESVSYRMSDKSEADHSHSSSAETTNLRSIECIPIGFSSESLFASHRLLHG